MSTQKLLRLTRFIPCVILIFFLLTGCQNPLKSACSPETLVVVGTVEPLQALPHFLAKELGYFEENNLSVKARWIQGTDLANEVQNDVKQPTIFLTNNQGTCELNSSCVLLAQLATGDLVLVGREPDPAFSWDHLQKQAVILPRQDSWSAQQSLIALHNQHLRPNFDYVLLDNIPDELTVNAFVYGTGDYFITNLSKAVKLENQANTQTITLIDKATGNTLGAGCITFKDTLTYHQATLQAYINAIYKAQLWLKKHSNTQAARLVGQHYQLYSRSELIALIGRYKKLGILTYTPIVPDTIPAIHNEIVKLADNNLDPWEITINNSLAKKAVELVKLEKPQTEK